MDGIQDLAVADGGDGNLMILLGNGDGTFTQAVSPMPVGIEPSSIPLGNIIAEGDFNGDGIPDLAVVNWDTGNSSDAVVILLGNGDGTFTQAASSPLTVGSEPVSIAVGDFNGDGIQDLAVANAGDGTVTILLGNGNGTFTQAASSPVKLGGEPVSIAVGDFNGDGISDLAITNGTVNILLGNGDGTFTQAASSPVQAVCCRLAAGDFNGDGNLDLAVANEGNGIVTILLGNGNGTFTSNSSMSVGTSPQAIAVGALNGDGIPSLAIADAADGTVAILLGNGNGTFTQAANSPVQLGGEPVSIAVGDFNGDGMPDLAIGNLQGNRAVNVLRSQYTATATVSGISLLGVGTHLIEASYLGDNNYNPSTSGTTPLIVPLLTPVVKVTPSSTSITTAQALTVPVTVNGPSGDPVPTGSVTLTSGSYTSGAVALNSGSATISIPAGSLATGTDTLTVSYSGDSNYTAATSTASVTVAVAVTPGASLSGGWQFTGTSTKYGLNFTGTVAILQTSSTLTGEAMLSGSACTPSAALSGSISGTAVTVQLNEGGQLVTFTGTANSDLTSMSGTYSAPSGGCTNGDSGTWSATIIVVAPKASLTGDWQFAGASTAFGLSFTGAVAIQQNGSALTGQATLPGSACASTAALSGSISGAMVIMQLNEGGQLVTFIGTANSKLTSMSGTYSAPSGGCTNGDHGTWSATFTSTSLTPVVKVTPSSTSITTAQALTVPVTVNGPSGDPVPTGSVTLTSGSYTSGAVALNSGSATISIPAGSLATGTDTLTVSYSGDSNYTAATSTASVTVAVAVTPGASLSGGWQFTGTSTKYGLNFTGTVAILQTSSTLTGEAMLSGSACTPSAALSGSISGTAVTVQLNEGGQLVTFTGTANSDLTSMSGTYSAPSGGCTNGDSGTWSATIIQVASNATLTGSWQLTGASTAYGIAVAGTVAIQQSSSTLTGQATLSGSACASTAALSGSITGTMVNVQLNEGGQLVTFTGTANSKLTSMSGTYTAPGGGCTNGDYGTWSATLIPQTPSFALKGTAVSLTPGATTSNSSTVTVTPAGGFTGSVTLTAAVTSSPTGAQYPPTFSFGSTSPVSITGTTAGTATLTITTTAATSAALVLPKRNGVPWYAAGSAALAGILLFGIPARRRSWRTMLGMLVFLVALTGGVFACGGGGSGGGGGGGTGNPGTTAGTYTVTVTGTSGTTTATGTVALTVQ